MISTKGVYFRWLLIFVGFIALGAILASLSKDDFSGYLVVLIGIVMLVLNLVKLVQIKKLEKICIVVQAKFVSIEQESVGYRNPRFAVTFEFEQDGKKIRLKTKGIYFAHDVSGLSDLSLITVGYTEDFRNVITL